MSRSEGLIDINLNNASICATAVRRGQYPTENLPEIALCGRSNVGKSSFINKMLNRKNLARTSSKPGKTATLNFYNIDDTVLFVDLPGYGYAAVSKVEKERWAVMINEYLSARSQLLFALLLVDARHDPSAQDIQMLQWLRARQKSVIVVPTKCDKVKKSVLQQNLERIWAVLELGVSDIMLPFSAQTGMGVNEAWEVFKQRLAEIGLPV